MKNKNILKKVVSLTLSSVLLLVVAVFFLEPVIVDAYSSSQGYTVTLNISKEVDISAPGNATFSTAIPGMSGNVGAPSTASSSFTVISNSVSGFNMSVNSSVAPALVLAGGTVFADYAPTSAGVPDYNWKNASGVAEFGYSVTGSGASGVDATQSFKAATTTCNTAGVNVGTKCWLNFTIAPKQIVNRSTNTGAGGVTEVVNYQAESNIFLISGAYVANITATVAVQ
jgi:hypothetical protein